MNKTINWDELIKSYNSFWVEIYSKQFHVVAWIMDHPTDELVQQIYLWPDERSMDWGGYGEDDDGIYIRLCSQLWNKITQYDSGCSHTNDTCYQFISDIVVKIIDHNTELQKQIKLDKIKRLQKEIDDLQRKN
jgi:hypothetical protein